MVMETRLIAAAYPVPEDAQSTVGDLRQAGLTESDISVVYTDPGHLVKAGILDGAVWGGVLGGMVGLLFPPIGLLVAAGPILGVLTAGVGFAAAGAVTVGAMEGVVSAMISVGMPKEVATDLGEHLRKGDALVIAHVQDVTLVPRVEEILGQHHPRRESTTSTDGVTSVQAVSG